MTEIYCDKFFSTERTSSAIEAVYYSTDERKLFVEFYNGSLAGYENVQPDIFNALNVINDNRLNGDESASVGGYYNEFFRKNRYFTGFETSDVEIVTDPDVVFTPDVEPVNLDDDGSGFTYDEQAAIQAIVDAGQPQVIEGAKQVFVAPVDNRRRFGVSFTLLETETAFNFNVNGTDENDALRRFNEAVELLGWAVKVDALTRFFD